MVAVSLQWWQSLYNLLAYACAAQVVTQGSRADGWAKLTPCLRAQKHRPRSNQYPEDLPGWVGGRANKTATKTLEMGLGSSGTTFSCATVARQLRDWGF